MYIRALIDEVRHGNPDAAQELADFVDHALDQPKRSVGSAFGLTRRGGDKRQSQRAVRNEMLREHAGGGRLVSRRPGPQGAQGVDHQPSGRGDHPGAPPLRRPDGSGASAIREVLAGIRRTHGTRKQAKTALLLPDIRRCLAAMPATLIGIRDRAVAALNNPAAKAVGL